MGTDSAHHHRPTLKQQNKPFKSKHASKGSLKDAAKGKVVRQSPKDSKKTTASLDQIRLNRRNTAKQTQAKKRASIVSATRLFTADGAPRIVAVIPLCEDLSPAIASKAVADALGATSDGCPEEGLWRVRAERFKTSLQLLNVPYGSLYTALDAAKCADYVLFLLSPITEVNSWGDTLLRTLQAQGLPSVVAACAPSGPTDAKSRTGILKSLLSFVRYFVPDHTRVLDLAADTDRLIAARALCEGRPRDVKWRESRPYVLVEHSQYTAEDGGMSLTGVVRGASLSANRLVHLPDVGDYQISKIVAAPLPRHHKSHINGDMEVEPAVLAEADTDAADSLISTNDPDDMANEQTWPTEDEMQNGDDHHQNGDSIPDAGNGTTPKLVRKVPKGTSAYQATWIVEDDSEAEDESREGEAGVAEPVEEEEMEDLPEVDMDAAETETDRRTVQFQDLEEEEEKEQLSKWRDRKREEQDDLEFPDEVDTPMDIPARERFQRYRGLRSMRTSPWDPYENLPRDYARIFQFEDFKRTEQSVKRRAETEAEESGVEPGTRVTIHMKSVPSSVSTHPPRMLFGLLPHEHKQTVLHFAVQRNTEYTEPVRSKDPLVLCVGPRRLRVRPVYSTHSPRGSNNVHKFSRYLRHGETLVASTYGPVVYGKVPCMLLRETNDVQAPHLVASGSFVDPDPTRIIAKRIMLTGHPFKVHRKTATIRYMFFNPDDVQYFAPIQLSTKHGRTGHIRESLGTHGYFKAHFDGPVSQMDTVCMSLYKRVYPRWAETWTPHSSAAITEVADDAMEE